jgi:hypothetical protein
MYNVNQNDYSIVENETSAFQGVKLKTGTWKNVIVIYGQVGVKEDTALDMATLSFNFTVQDPADFNVDELEKDESFKNYLGSILQYIITDSLQHGGHIGKSTTDSHPKSPST